VFAATPVASNTREGRRGRGRGGKREGGIVELAIFADSSPPLPQILMKKKKRGKRRKEKKVTTGNEPVNSGTTRMWINIGHGPTGGKEGEERKEKMYLPSNFTRD